jgi:hypothetical protein
MWLRGLGLERFEPAFRENEIDAEVLPALTEAHLAALGLPLGPRLKLLQAIAALAKAVCRRPPPRRPPLRRPPLRRPPLRRPARPSGGS